MNSLKVSLWKCFNFTPGCIWHKLVARSCSPGGSNAHLMLPLAKRKYSVVKVCPIASQDLSASPHIFRGHVNRCTSSKKSNSSWNIHTWWKIEWNQVALNITIMSYCDVSGMAVPNVLCVPNAQQQNILVQSITDKESICFKLLVNSDSERCNKYALLKQFKVY